MTTEAMRGRLGGMVGRLLDLGASEDGGGSGRLVLTATLDLSPDGSGQPPVFQVLRSAAREVGAGLESRDVDALDAEVTALLEAAEDANDRGLLGFVWTSSVDRDARGQDGPLAVLELAAPIRSSVHVGEAPRVFEVARAAYLDRSVVLVTTDLHTMDVTRVRYGTATDTDGVDWPAHYLSKRGQRTGRDAQGAGGQGAGNAGHTYNNVRRYVEEQRNLFANEAAENLARFLSDDDLLVVEGVDEARSQLLGRLPEALASRARQEPAAPHGEGERDRFARLQAIARESQILAADDRAEAWFSGAEANAISGPEAIRTACEQGRVATVIVHEDATDHLGTAEDVRLQSSPVNAETVEALLQAALRQGAEVIFADDERLLALDGIVAIGRF